MTADDTPSIPTADDAPSVAVVGGGPAGLSAAIFTARHGLDTTVLSGGSPILRRNALVENYPGFPAGVDSRLLLDMMTDQAEEAGATIQEATVTRVERDGGGFAVETAEGEDALAADFIIAATKNVTDYLAHLDGVELLDRGKTYVATDGRGRTGHDGLYAAGRLARQPHQAIVCAGHGATVAITLLENAEVAFYHDWTAPDRYFTGRDRDVPPGCEEIGEDERRRREQESMATMRDYFADPHPEEPEQHPSVEE